MRVLEPAMAMHNNEIANNHFHKKWQQYVRCHFNQATQAKSRRIKRAAVCCFLSCFHIDWIVSRHICTSFRVPNSAPSIFILDAPNHISSNSKYTLSNSKQFTDVYESKIRIDVFLI